MASSDRPTRASEAPAVPTGGEHALLSGRYELLGLIGAGGMGNVYKARDLELDELVALKVIRSDIADVPGTLERFRREVKLARRVTHKNVARVFDIGSHLADKYLTMEYVDGESLATIVERDGRLPLPRVAEIVAAICAGLTAAHAAGVIHRDLKPENVLMATDGRVVITDFGIARAHVDPKKTLGVPIGTPAYMAPEQVEGAADIDARADVYALGATIYELLTGLRPWPGESAIAVAAARLVHPPPNPSLARQDLPDPWSRLVTKCMARQREERYPSAQAVAAALAVLTLPAEQSTQVAAPPAVHVPVGMPGATQQRDKTIAVLPFRNIGAAEDDAVAEGLTDDLIDTLSMTRGLKLRPRSIVEKSASTSGDPRDVGRELGVQIVVEGSIRKRPGTVRVSARVVSVDDGYQIWAKRFERPDNEMLAINDDVARSVALALTTDLMAPVREVPNDAAAVDLYLRARAEHRKSTMGAFRTSATLYEEALARAPDDPTILAGYAVARARIFFFTGTGRAEVIDASARAVAAAPHLGEAQYAQATVRLHLGDVAGALEGIGRALARSPGLAEAHGLAGRILAEIGMVNEAFQRLEIAFQIDPKVPLVGMQLARMNALLGRWDEVDRRLEMLSPLDDPMGYWSALGRMILWRGDTKRAAELLPSIPSDGNILEATARLFQIAATKQLPPDTAASVEVIRALGSSTPRARAFVRQIETEIQAYTGHFDEALKLLGEAVDAGLIDLTWLEQCPVLDPMRSMPGFKPLRDTVHERARVLVDIARTALT